MFFFFFLFLFFFFGGVWSYRPRLPTRVAFCSSFWRVALNCAVAPRFPFREFIVSAVPQLDGGGGAVARTR
ncbi:hypothetical protein TRSC58_07257 [Trypanosoma rangeli SC58]|uniref:Secreted protein n=1 Tax=Trypanosoma rangeli SC58 TaxID=429131 RepID=A0A061IVU9_TRYRA|nr:hypothetical protein TRSC58_07257 [Trypanosoma rangeli SC58]